VNALAREGSSSLFLGPKLGISFLIRVLIGLAEERHSLTFLTRCEEVDAHSLKGLGIYCLGTYQSWAGNK
jgi:hypothetical protein